MATFSDADDDAAAGHASVAPRARIEPGSAGRGAQLVRRILKIMKSFVRAVS